MSPDTPEPTRDDAGRVDAVRTADERAPLDAAALDAIEARANRGCRCDDDDCVTQFVQLVTEDAPALIAEVKRMRAERVPLTDEYEPISARNRRLSAAPWDLHDGRAHGNNCVPCELVRSVGDVTKLLEENKRLWGVDAIAKELLAKNVELGTRADNAEARCEDLEDRLAEIGETVEREVGIQRLGEKTEQWIGYPDEQVRNVAASLNAKFMERRAHRTGWREVTDA